MPNDKKPQDAQETMSIFIAKDSFCWHMQKIKRCVCENSLHVELLFKANFMSKLNNATTLKGKVLGC